MEIHLSAMNAIRFVAAVLVTVAAGLAGELYLSRHRRERSLLYFFLGASAYAARLLLQALGNRTSTAALLLTLFIPIPMILFLVETVAPEWRKASRWIVSVNAAVAVFALLTRVLHLNPGYAWSANSIVVLIQLPILMAMTFFPRRLPDRDLKVVRAGTVIFLVIAIYSNLQGLRLAPGPDLEFLGFIVVLSCLGEVALRRTLHNEERLLTLNNELEIARGIQTKLLPEPIVKAGELTIASRYVPATSVAGDFFDFLVKDNGLGVLIADVSGHGIPAALSASMVKLAVRAQMQNAENPALVLRGMNSILHGNLQGQFVSAGYLFLNPACGTLMYAGAGHPPLVVWHSCSQRAETLVENGLPLGIFADGSYKSREFPLGKGDRCVLYTDGLLEAPCPSGEEFGPERLIAFVAEHAALAAQAFCDKLVARVSEWRGAAQQAHDDLTIVVVDLA